jgi:hypothetical protein
MTELGLALGQVQRNQLMIIWTMFIDRLSTIPGITVNRKLQDSLNNWEDPSQWPSIQFRSLPTSDELLSYKDHPFNVMLNLNGDYQFAKITFEPTNTPVFKEMPVYYAGCGRSTKYCDVDCQITLAALIDLERSGKLDREQVVSMFSSSYDKYCNNIINWSLTKEPLEVVAAKMEAIHQKLLNSNNETSFKKQEDRLYARYLKNRWPRVKALLKINET